MDGVGQAGEVVRQQFGVGQSHHRGPDGLGQRPSVGEIGVGEMRVPVEIVVDRVIDAAAILAAEAQVQRRDAQVIEEGRVVGAGAERVDAQVGAVANVLPVFGRLGVGDGFSWSRFQTVIFVSGSSMSRATPLMNFSSVCEPSMPR